MGTVKKEAGASKELRIDSSEAIQDFLISNLIAFLSHSLCPTVLSLFSLFFF